MDPVQPLLTIFTPPTTCSTRMFTLLDTDRPEWITWDPSEILDLETPTTLSCYPSAWISAATLGNWATYSPGVCPDGYTMYSTRTDRDDPGATIAFCCPSGFVGQTDYEVIPECSRSIAEATPALYYTTDSERQTQFAGTTTIPSPKWAVASGFRVAWKSSDLDRFTPRSAPLQQLENIVSIPPSEYSVPSNVLTAPPSRLPSTQRPTSDSTPKMVPTALPRPEKNRARLSRKAITGIEVGVVLGSLVVLGIIILLVLRRRQRSKKHLQRTGQHN